jgi:adenylate cyclase
LIPAILFPSFRARIAAFIVGLLVASLGLVLFAVNQVSTDNALLRINADLDASARLFQRVLQDRNQNLLERARFLSSDHAYRQVYGFGSRRDLELVTANHQRRIGADLMMLISMDEEVLADTLHPGNVEVPLSLQAFIERAYDSDDGETKAILLVDSLPYQLVIVPLYAPDPVAMVVVGFQVDELLVTQLKQDTSNTDVSLIFGVDKAQTGIAACTLPPSYCEEQAAQFQLIPPQIGTQTTRVLGGEPFITRILPLLQDDTNNIAVLQRSLNAELASWYQLRSLLFLIFAGTLLISIIGA